MGFIEVSQKAAEPTIHELKTVLEDGQRAAVKCRPLVPIDYWSIPIPGFNALPILSGTRKIEELSDEEKLRFYSWMREVVKKAIVAVRDVKDGESIWRPVIVTDEDLESAQESDDKIKISLRVIERLNAGDVMELATAIVLRSNLSTELEAAKRAS